MRTEDCTPSLSGYEIILRAIKEKESKTEDDLKTIEQLGRYISAQEE